MRKHSQYNLLLVLAAAVAAIPLSAAHTAELSDRLSGRILLQVQRNGEAWYVSPKSGRRIFLGRPDDAFSILRTEGIGITDADLRRVPVGLPQSIGADTDGDGLGDLLENALGTTPAQWDSDSDGYDDREETISGYNPTGHGGLPIDKSFTAGLSGKIFLQVERHGEAWWVNPIDQKRYFLGRPADAFEIMRSFGLGITDDDLQKISEAGVEVAAGSPSKTEATSTAATGQAEAFVSQSAPTLTAANPCPHDDLDCLIDRIESKTAGEVAVDREWIEDGVHTISGETWRFGPVTGGRYALSMVTDARTSEMDPVMKSELLNLGTPTYELEQSEAEIQRLASETVGTDRVCVTDNLAALADTVSGWKMTTRSTADLDFAECCTFNADGKSEPGLACDADFPDLQPQADDRP